MRALGVWCKANDLPPIVNKTKELVVHFRKEQREHSPIHIDRTAVEKVKTFKFLGVHVTDKLKWFATAPLQPQEA